MIDFLRIATRTGKHGVIEVYPNFIITKSKDLMIRGSDFYAIWLEERGLWSTEEQDALQLIDRELDIYVDKGIPLHSLLDSASRHLAKYMVGMDDEDHLRAACWNLLWALNQRETHPELDDRFVAKMKSSNNEPIITVVCSSCGRHFEAPTEWWVRKRAQYTNIPDGVITTCPHCGNATIVRETNY